MVGLPAVELTVDIKAPIEKVFEAWKNPELMMQWMREEGVKKAVQIEIDFKEGGLFLIDLETRGGIFPITGKYLLISPFTQLHFTWKSPGTENKETVVKLNFEAVSENATRLFLNQTEFLNLESAGKNNRGWKGILWNIEKVIT